MLLFSVLNIITMVIFRYKDIKRFRYTEYITGLLGKFLRFCSSEKAFKINKIQAKSSPVSYKHLKNSIFVH